MLVGSGMLITTTIKGYSAREAASCKQNIRSPGYLSCLRTYGNHDGMSGRKGQPMMRVRFSTLVIRASVIALSVNPGQITLPSLASIRFNCLCLVDSAGSAPGAILAAHVAKEEACGVSVQMLRKWAWLRSTWGEGFGSNASLGFRAVAYLMVLVVSQVRTHVRANGVSD